MTVKYTYSRARDAMVPYYMHEDHPDVPAWGDTFSPTVWAILATLVAVGICLVFTVVYAAVSHAIHPDCASVLACVRL